MLTTLQQAISALAALITIVNAQAAVLPENNAFLGGRFIITEEFEAKVTAYSSSVDETDSTPFIAADGSAVGEGMIACPRRFKFGTLFYINELIYKCNDRMALRFDDRLDLWASSKEKAVKWGIKSLNVRVIEPLY